MSSTGDIQDLIDSLAADLGRPVSLDDRHFRSLAYSSHPDSVDPVRMASILRRVAPPGVVAWLRSLGVDELDRSGRVPANRELEMAARVCVPVRFDGALLGFLWLIDEPTALSGDQLDLAGSYVEDLAVILYRSRVLEIGTRERERLLLAGAVAREGSDPEAAASELAADGHLSPPPHLVLVLRATHPEGRSAPPPIRVRLADATERLRRTVAPHHLVTLDVGEESIVALAPISEEEGDQRAAALAQLAGEALSGHPDWKVSVGVGELLDGAAAILRSYRQAAIAARLHNVLRGDPRVIRWSDLGAYRTIVGLVGERPEPAYIPPALSRLTAHPDAATLLQTLERFLDLGGDVRAAAEELFLHRTSLYDRLHRIEELAAVDLHSGEDRLELHLGIRMLRLEGRLEEPRQT